ncbi:MAG TPA: carboxypeptidase-like regulatory domain-containing protein [Hymenobacter sp.]|jgi:hypothetical protein
MKSVVSGLIALFFSLTSLVGHAQSGQVPASSVQKTAKPSAQGAPKPSVPSAMKLPVEVPSPAEVIPEVVVPPVVVPPPVRELTGTVLSESGMPVAGATVAIVGEKSQSTSTNSAGAYVLHSAAAAPVLHVSYAGYEDDEQTMSADKSLVFNLVPIEGYKRQLKKQSKAANKAYRK